MIMDNGKVIQVGVTKHTVWNRQQYRCYSVMGVAPCINTVGGGGLEPKIIMGTDKTICLNSKVDGKQPSLADRIYDVEGIADRRIRKLTPRECFRLQGVDDADIDTIQSVGISNSQQYKMAGNSITVDVLYHLFRKMFCETENESMYPTLL